MGEVERIHSTYGSTFGGYHRQIVGAKDQNSKRQSHQDQASKEDALELHETSDEAPTEPVKHILHQDSSDEHIDLSA